LRRYLCETEKMPAPKSGKIRALIAEDQAMVLGALAALLDMEGDIEVVGRAANGTDALRLVQQLRPEVLITDIEMPGLTGLELADQLSLSEGTVRNYLSEAISKLGAANRVEAARIARSKGWL